MTTDTPTAPPDPRAPVERVQRALNAHDLDAFVARSAPDDASEPPAHPDRTFRGRARVRRTWVCLFASIPDLRAARRGAAGAGAGETAWTVWAWTGTQERGAPVDWRGVIRFGVRGGQRAWGRRYMEAVARAGPGTDAAVRRMTGTTASAGPGA